MNKKESRNKRERKKMNTREKKRVRHRDLMKLKDYLNFRMSFHQKIVICVILIFNTFIWKVMVNKLVII